MAKQRKISLHNELLNGLDIRAGAVYKANIARLRGSHYALGLLDDAKLDNFDAFRNEDGSWKKQISAEAYLLWHFFHNKELLNENRVHKLLKKEQVFNRFDNVAQLLTRLTGAGLVRMKDRKGWTLTVEMEDLILEARGGQKEVEWAKDKSGGVVFISSEHSEQDIEHMKKTMMGVVEHEQEQSGGKPVGV